MAALRWGTSARWAITSRPGSPRKPVIRQIHLPIPKISEKWGFLRDTTVTTGIVMFVIYFVCSAVAGTEYLRTITDQNMLIFSILTGLQFAVGVAIVYNGVRLILGDLVPAFQGISQKLIPNSIPAVDCAVFLPLAQPPWSWGSSARSLAAWWACFSSAHLAWR